MNYLAIVELSLFACFTIFLGYCTIKLGKSAIGLIRTCEKLNEESDKMCKDIEPFLDFLTKAKIAMEEIEHSNPDGNMGSRVIVIPSNNREKKETEE